MDFRLLTTVKERFKTSKMYDCYQTPETTQPGQFCVSYRFFTDSKSVSERSAFYGFNMTNSLIFGLQHIHLGLK